MIGGKGCPGVDNFECGSLATWLDHMCHGIVVYMFLGLFLVQGIIILCDKHKCVHAQIVDVGAACINLVMMQRLLNRFWQGIDRLSRDMPSSAAWCMCVGGWVVGGMKAAWYTC